jgi:hypothetical protein
MLLARFTVRIPTSVCQANRPLDHWLTHSARVFTWSSLISRVLRFHFKAIDDFLVVKEHTQVPEKLGNAELFRKQTLLSSN